MKRRRRTGWRLGLSALLAFAAVGLWACGPLERQELKDSVDIVHSNAAEGAVLADDVAHGRTTANFARVQAGELSSEAQHQAEKLNDARPVHGLGDEVQTAIEIASDVSSALDDLRTSPNDREQARKSRSMLQKAARESDKLGMGL